MLVALMAIIDLGRMKITAVTRWLWLALSGGMFVAAPLGCENTNDPECEDIQLLYGPPPDLSPYDPGQEDLNIQPLYGAVDVAPDSD